MHPIWAGLQGQLPGVMRSDWLSQHLGAVGPKCAMTGGGTAGRLHSKPLGFSTQLTVQPVKGMLVVSQLLAALGVRAVEIRRRWADMSDNRRAHHSHSAATKVRRITWRVIEHIARGGYGAAGHADHADCTGGTGEHIVRGGDVAPGRGNRGITAPQRGTRQDAVTMRRVRARGHTIHGVNTRHGAGRTPQ